MKNYINIEGKKIYLTAEQVDELRSIVSAAKVKLAEIAPGDCFSVGDNRFVVLEHCGGSTAVILKDCLPETSRFGTNNNFDGSIVDDICDDFGDELEKSLGNGALEEHVVDLTSDDGLKDYGEVTRKVSLITCEQYRKYVEILDKHKPDRWWWLATPYSTKRHENDRWVKCVAPSGFVSGDNYRSGSNGVRPFCIFKSSIFVSK